jgi:WD40 repeat protein
MRKLILTGSFFPLAFSLAAQLPDTDIWLLDLKAKDSTYVLGAPVNITSRTGYDNQPAFAPEGGYLLYSSIREDGQSDIYKYDLKAKTVSAFCKTAESEYSPTFTPDRKFVSTVRVEKDSAQRLWKYPVNGGEPVLVMNAVDSIGYHCWLNPDSVALFILTQPFTLQVANANTQKVSVISDSIGKSLVRFPFMRSAGLLFIRSVNGRNKVCFTTLRPVKKKGYEVNEIVDLPSGADYFTFYNNVLFCASGSRIYKYEMMKDLNWVQVADLSKAGLSSITRLTISPDGSRMAVVNSK